MEARQSCLDSSPERDSPQLSLPIAGGGSAGGILVTAASVVILPSPALSKQDENWGTGGKWLRSGWADVGCRELLASGCLFPPPSNSWCQIPHSATLKEMCTGLQSSTRRTKMPACGPESIHVAVKTTLISRAFAEKYRCSQISSRNNKTGRSEEAVSCRAGDSAGSVSEEGGK